MTTAKEISAILESWRNDGLVVGEIREKYNLTPEESFAILFCGGGLTVQEIESGLDNIKPGMKGKEIKAVMQPAKDGE